MEDERKKEQERLRREALEAKKMKLALMRQRTEENRRKLEEINKVIEQKGLYADFYALFLYQQLSQCTAPLCRPPLWLLHLLTRLLRHRHYHSNNYNRSHNHHNPYRRAHVGPFT